MTHQCARACAVFAATAALLALCACAGGPRQPEATTVPPAPEQRLPAPYDDTWAKAPEPARPASPAPAKAEVPTREAAPSAVRQMLASIGLEPDAPLPEGFVLDVPDTAATGRPFLVRVGRPGLVSAKVEWRGRALTLTPDANGVCEALLAEPLKKEAERRPLAVTLTGGGPTETMRAELTIVEPPYPVQRLKVPPKYVNPPKSELERIKRNQQAVREAVSKVSPEKFWRLPLHRPVPGEVTSLYGVRRVFNGEERGRHKGVDYDGNTGDPIGAADAGIVVLAEDQYYGGNTVIVDHGLGVFSMYLHLSAINVAEGQKVQRGETVGLIGATGRVTGPHLHLSFYVAGESVDASPLLE